MRPTAHERPPARLNAAAGIGAVVVSVATLIASLFASPVLADPLVGDEAAAISAKSPFPDRCGVPGVQTGAEVGPVLAVNPHRPRYIVAAWEQDVDEGEQALSVPVAVSRDGGETFQHVLVPGLSRCTGGAATYAAEPSLAYGLDGTLYLATRASSADTHVQVSRSRTNGLTWEDPLEVAREARRGVIATDPAVPGRAYAAVTAGRPEGAAIALATTTNAGSSWSPPRSIYAPLAAAPALHDLAVGPDGALLLVLEQSTPLPPATPGEEGTPILVMRSSDRGESWSEPIEIGRLPDTLLPHDPEHGEPGKNEGAVGAPAIATVTATSTGAIVAWQSNLALDEGQILVVRSTDGGASWSEPAPAVSPGAQVFTPELAAAHDGTLALSWYDLRSDRPGDGELTTSAHLAHSHDGGQSWTEVGLGKPFDLRRAPEHYGHSLGFRQGLAPLGGGFAAAFVQAPPEALDGPSDVFLARLTPPRTTSRITLRVRPRVVPVRRRTRFRFHATVRSGGAARPVAGARITFAGKRMTADTRGRAAIVAKLRQAGRHRARASKPSFRSGRATVRATRAPRRR